MNLPATPVAAIDPEISAGSDFAGAPQNRDDVPGVFLMTNSFETGGSERQFVDLARALQPTKYRVSLGCLQENGPLRIDLGEVQHFDLGGSLYQPRSMTSTLPAGGVSAAE